MFLKQLKIKNKFGVIRTIEFREGLNLIVDETPIGNRKKTGNSIGKTTVLRLIDYCLGSDGQNIYQDTEFKEQDNTTIKNFLIDSEVLVSLTLVDDLALTDNTITIERNFLKRTKKVQTINGESITDIKDFNHKLKELIFNSKVDKPSFRQIISKNIRDEKSKLTNIVRVLSPYTSQEEYEALFFFWLGVDTDSHDIKEKLAKDKSKEITFQRRLKKEGEISLIEQQLLITNSKIDELRKLKDIFNFNEEFESQVESLNEIKLIISKLTTEYSRLNMRKELIIDSKNDLESEKADIDVDKIKFLYNNAAKLIPDLQVLFEDTVEFHNDLIDEKIRYIEKELPDLTSRLKRISIEVKDLRIKEQELSELIGSSDFSADYEKVLTDLNGLYEIKGNLEERKKLWITSNETLERINDELDSINEGINSQNSLIQKRVALFNKHFAKISNKLYGEEYLLSTVKTERAYDLIITNLEGNPSTGKKKGQIAAFDFAYILFAEEVGIEYLHFILHDQLENIHDNQLSTILIDLANSINCQFVLPIVRDKIPEGLDIDKYIILQLKENDKLFKV